MKKAATRTEVARRGSARVKDDPLWYKDGVIYQLHVRSFFDSKDDGIGDLEGLTRKLDYLHDLGVNAIWLLPFYPSPLKDDGYDIADYTEVNPIYGNLRDFRTFLREAHRRGLRVITELVINHTSDQHPWFQRARNAKPGSRWRDYYVWSETAEKYREARIIFKDFENSNWSWDPVARAYYWHRFYHHQPDLNFENPEVKQAVFRALDFWMKMGVDGLRLDAIPYLYEREGTSCENLPETHEFLKELRRHVDQRFRNRMLLAEANQWPEDAIAYFGDGDECHVAFHFPLMPRLFMSVAMEDRFPIVDILEQTPQIPANSQWALFLRNHDELTLEMVTDEDRDYMWKTYATNPQARINLGIRRRLAPLLGNHRGRIELMNGLLFAFPGTPIIYYGDEIGMGDNIYLGDRNGVRTPMQWSSDRNAGFSRSNPQKLFLPIIIDPEYHYEAINVEAQQNNPHSLLWWTKRLIDLRKRYKAFGRGTMEFLYPKNRKILVFLREYQDELILVVANLSRFVQAAEVDMSRWEGMVPVELFGQTPFPPIGELPYFFTIGPHAFYWFSLERRGAIEIRARDIPRITIPSLDDLFEGTARNELAGVLGSFLRDRRWFAGKARTIKKVSILDVIRSFGAHTELVIVQVDYSEGAPEMYQIPVGVRIGDSRPEGVDKGHVIARFSLPQAKGILYEAVVEKEFGRHLLQTIGSRKQFRGETGVVQAVRTRVWQQLRAQVELVEPEILRAEQSNTAIRYGQTFFMKLFRKLESGINGDFEINRFLTEKTDFRHIAPVAGALELVREGREPITLALLQQYVPNGGDVWSYTLNVLRQYFDRCLSDASVLTRLGRELPGEPLVDLAEQAIPDAEAELLGNYLEAASVLGRRTAQMHLALASRPDDPDFKPEPFTPHYQRSIFQQMRSEVVAVMPLLRSKLPELEGLALEEAGAVLGAERKILDRFQALLQQKISVARIRCHGDFHLAQVLQTGDDFIIVDFEGEPSRPLSQRRIKRSALRDVAGMLRSFHYAPFAVLLGKAPGATVRSEDAAALEVAANFWYRWVSAVYLRSYLATASGSIIAPRSRDELKVLLDAYLLEKALYELAYELGNRPEWVRIPLRGILELVAGE
ncbi:MAG TPA: maltose alpha-D-glucosyltransferase [Thermoanaerobaculia bacterium]|nr:maltose alpha-D-glucosyltransferase [Thermoanaerobaculia bacterium]